MRGREESSPPLEAIYYGEWIKPLKIVERPIVLKFVDLEKQKRRVELEELVVNRFAIKSLEERLEKNKQVGVGDVLKEGLFGFLPDDALISDIIPQGEGYKSTDKIIFDPLWKSISENLNPNQIKGVLAIFKAVERASEKLKDDTRKIPVSKSLNQEHLLTIADLRSVDEASWARLTGIGETRASILFEATRKLD